MARTEGRAAKRRSTISVFFARPLLSLAVLVCEDLYMGETRVLRRQRAVKSNTGNDKSKLLLLQSLVKFLTTFFTAFFFQLLCLLRDVQAENSTSIQQVRNMYGNLASGQSVEFLNCRQVFHIMIIDYWRTERYRTMEYGKSERQKSLRNHNFSCHFSPLR